MNYMKQVAEMLGVELHKEFYVLEFDEVDGSVEKRNKWFLDEEGLHNCTDPSHLAYDYTISDYVLCRLLRGKYLVEKISWKPKENDSYYTIVHGRLQCEKIYLAEEFNWIGDSGDYACHVTGNCFKTKEEAEANIPWYKANIERVNRGEKWQVEHD